jgi:hypothetical protein
MCDLAPIATAPIRVGEHFGPCLLYGRTEGEDEEDRYGVGYWIGDEWSVGGAVFTPTHFYLLPKRPESQNDPLKAVVDEIGNYAHLRLLGFMNRIP